MNEIVHCKVLSMCLYCFSSHDQIDSELLANLNLYLAFRFSLHQKLHSILTNKDIFLCLCFPTSKQKMNTKPSITCHDCLQQYDDVKAFEKHTSDAHGKPFQCMICNKTFAKDEELAPHKWQIHNIFTFKSAKLPNNSNVEARKEKRSYLDVAKAGIAEKREINDPNAHERPSKKTKLEDQSDENQRLHEIIKNLKEDNVKLYKEVSELKGLKTDVQNQAQIIKNLREENVKLYEQNVNLKYSK